MRIRIDKNCNRRLLITGLTVVHTGVTISDN